jgi:hypothetical protein
MTAGAASLAFWPDQHRFFDDLVTMLMSLSSYMFTLSCTIKSNNPREFVERNLDEWISYIRPVKDPEHYFILEELSTKGFLVFYPFWIINPIALNGWPQAIEFRYITDNRAQSEFSITSDKNRQILSRIVGASFVNYYAAQKENIENRYGKNFQNWPSEINFARTVRNGFAHGGASYVENPNASPISWRIWSIDHRHNGIPVLFAPSGLGIGDVIRLMEDVDKLISDNP